MRFAIWYQFYNLKIVKNTHGVVLLLVKLQASHKESHLETVIRTCPVEKLL